MLWNKKRRLNLAWLAVAVVAVVFISAGTALAQNLPVADAGEDVNMFLGESVDLYGTATDSSGDPVLNPSWLWTVDVKPAGSTPILTDPTGQNPYFIPDMVGDYVLSLVVSDGTYESLPDSISVHVALNLPPVAVATADITTGTVPLTVNFDASQSFDPEGGPVNVEWSFPDGTVSVEIAPTHLFEWIGTHLVGLQVWDDWGQLAQDTILITVCGDGINCPPVADAGEDVDMFFGESVVLSGSATDPDGDAIFAWQWTIESKPPESIPYLSDPTGQNPYFIPDMAGDYVLSLIASDGISGFGLPDEVTVHVVLNLPPVAIATADVTTGPVPLTVNFDASQSFDPEGTPITIQWAFSDGSYSSEIAPTHVFQWAGTYLVSLRVWDDWYQVAQDTLLITVTEPIGNIEVSPAEYDFGEVELGTSSTVIVTISNVGGADLTVETIAFEAGSSGDFAITTAPSLPAVVAPGGILGDVEITYAASAAGLAAAGLEIVSDDPDEPLVVVSLIGTGVVVEPPPSEQIQAVLDFFDASVDGGILVGDGPGNSAERRLNALRNMIETAGDLIEDGLLGDACEQLQAAYKKTDGEPRPPDFVTGAAASELAILIQDLMTSIGCG